MSGTYTYEDVLVPEIAYVSDKKMIAIGDSEIIIFDGKKNRQKKPKLNLIKKQIMFFTAMTMLA